MSPEQTAHYVDARPLVNARSATYWWSAHRFMRAYEKYLQLSRLVVGVVERAKHDPPRVRSLDTDGSFSRPSNEYDADRLFLFDERREASFLGSEAMHHLRSSLDHLVYHAAWRDSGQEQELTQFPACKKSKDWANRAGKDLKGLSSDHVSLIESAQPMRGVAWSGYLADLSNADKHRIGIDIGLACSLHVDYSNPVVDPRDARYLMAKTRVTHIECQILHDDDRREVSALFNEMFAGACVLINEFLREEGLPEIAQM